MDAITFNHIVNGTPGVIIAVNASDLKTVVQSMVNGEQERTRKAIEAHKERPTLTRQEAAKALNVTLSTLWRWEKDGYLQPVKIGRKVLYRASDIESILCETTN